jgi:carboxylate-amine ligase
VTFNTSEPFTIGMELEVRLLDSASYDIKNCANILFENIDDEFKPHVHKELLQSMVEIVTPVCRSSAQAVEFIERCAKRLNAIGTEHGFFLSALATHPFEKKEQNLIIPNERYERFEQEFQIVLKKFLISGLHIHIGIPSREKAIAVYNAAINYLPIFLALSANSVYLNGEDSGLKSYRSKIFEQLPRASIPQYLNDYKEYEMLHEQLLATGTIESFKDVWSDVRISPKFGTVELRVCDSFYNKERLELLGLLFQAVCVYTLRDESHRPKREFDLILEQNKWSACRYGMYADFIQEGKKYKLRDKIFELIDTLKREGIFEFLQASDKAEALIELTKQNTIAHEARAIYEKTQDFKQVIDLNIIR